MSEAAPNSNFTENTETKKVVTPFAFGVHESLLGMRLASPKRRLAAISIDLVAIGLLTTVDSLWLSIVVFAVCVWSLYQMRGQGGMIWAKVSLTAVALIALLTIAFQTVLSNWLKEDKLEASIGETTSVLEGKAAQKSVETYRVSDVDPEYSLVLLGLRKSNGDVACGSDEECDNEFFEALSRDIIKKDYSRPEAEKIFDSVKAQLDEKGRLDDDTEPLTFTNVVYDNRLLVETSGSSKPIHSVLAWLQGILRDLGLSFGWAAVYFSVLTGWWKGQTIGKRMLGIKVVRIDAKPIDLWESFGRYGGYSAGAATGLMGFLQIYWDANRQAIQDKISETLVIRP